MKNQAERDLLRQHPKIIVEPGSGHREDAAHATAFRRNSAKLMSEWLRLLDEQPGEWVAVYGDEMLATAATLEALWDLIPEEQRHDAVVKPLVDPTVEASASQGRRSTPCG